jgi:ParB family chromosome partitioning protein
MDDRSNNAAFEPTEPLKDDATTPTTQESVDSLCAATPPIRAAVTESREPDPHTRPSGDEAGGQMSGQVREIAIADITIPPTKRALKEESVEQIMTSMPEFGLGGTPLTVYRGEEADKFVLITGGHRLEAARRLGGTVIAANIVDWEPDRRRMWEIVENLHRAELTELERAEQTVELIKLRERRAQKGQVSNEADKPSQLATVSKGGRGKKGGIRGAARELGISKDDAHRSLKIDGLPEPAKQVARETGLDENRRVLLEAAKAEDSVAFLREQSARRDTKKGASVSFAPNLVDESADIVVRRLKPEDIPLIKPVVEAQPRDFAEALLKKLQAIPTSDGGVAPIAQKRPVKRSESKPAMTEGTGTIALRRALGLKLDQFLAGDEPAAKDEKLIRELRKAIKAVNGVEGPVGYVVGLGTEMITFKGEPRALGLVADEVFGGIVASIKTGMEMKPPEPPLGESTMSDRGKRRGMKKTDKAV